MIRLRPSGADEVLIKRVRDWYEPGPGVFIAPQALFNPALLFTTGVNGTWYDPSDLNTLFQDAAGTAPVTAVEQPVGLMLDKSKGLVLGPELVTNGNFSNGATSWSLGEGWAIVGGQAVRTPSTFGSVLSQPISVTAGKTYKVTYTITAYASQVVQVIFSGGTQVLGTPRSSVGTFTEYLTANAGNNTLWMTTSNAATSLAIDNISICELPGNHAFNSSGNSANFPVLSARYNLATETEFRNGLTDAPVRGGLVTATTLIGYSGAIAFGHDGSTSSYAYKIQTLAGSMQYTLRIIVQMTDGNPPLFPSSTPSNSNNDFAFVVGSDTPNPSTATVSSLGSEFT